MSVAVSEVLEVKEKYYKTKYRHVDIILNIYTVIF